MLSTIYDVCGIGNAIVDVLSPTTDSFLAEQGLAKGGMMLIDEPRAEFLYKFMQDATQCAGGSAANTIAGIASLGGMPAFIGRVRQDEPGEIFRYDMRKIGVHFDTPAAPRGKSTARCYIFVTPDAQRTMNTYLGACNELDEEDVNDALVAHSKITYIEGYLWDLPKAKDAIRKALKVAKLKNRKVAFSLSDAFCIERHRDEFLQLLPQIDILFANEHEIISLMRAGGFAEAREKIRGQCPVIALTRSEKGSTVIAGAETVIVAAEKNLKVIDTTGAGDLYASGFLYGFTQNWPLKACGQLGSKCASYIIQQIGARPATPLNALL